MYASLGAIRFQGLKGFDKFDSSASANYAEHARIRNKPGLQRVGQNLETIDISIQFHRQFCTPEDEIRALTNARVSGEIMPLVLGSGVYLGDFVITSMNQSIKQTDGQGNIVHVVVDAQLKEFYDPDKLQTKEAKARLNAFASDPESAIPVVRPPEAPTYPEKDLSDTIGQMNMSASSVDADMYKIKSFPDQAEYYGNRINKRLSDVNGSIGAVNALLASNNDMLLRAPDLPDALSDLARVVQDFLAVDPAANFPGAEAANAAFQSAMRGVAHSSTAIINSVIVRRIVR
jgi:phage protein U